MPINVPLRVVPKRLALVHVPEDREPESFAESVRAGLTARPKVLSCRYFYDEAGSALFERICDLPEYYLTRTEDAILRDHAEAMVSGWNRPPVLIELGSGSSTKTRRLLEAALETYESVHYVPIDVSPTILEASARELIGDYATLRVTGYVGDYRLALDEIAERFRGPKLAIFLGSSLGNYDDPAAESLLRHVGRALGPQGKLLLGTDLAKEARTLEAAYDDAQGVSAAFNLNLLTRINRELGADFDLDQFQHEARYRADLGRVEMHLVSQRDQTVSIADADLMVNFARGESIHTENSRKYTPEALANLAQKAGFTEESSWTDAEGRFRVQSWRPTGL